MFNPYPWQEKPWRFLTSEVIQDRLAHALLMHGIDGLGKRDFALAFAAFLLCDRRNDQSACGECQSCQWFQAGSHPDFFHVALEEKSKSIKVDQLRSLTEALQKTSQRGGYQIALIEAADTMNRSAANALLKTLEEPPGNVVVILVSDHLNTIPATIVSRCQYIGFCPPVDNESIQWLQEKVGDDVDAALLLKVADHAPLRALNYLQCGYFDLRDQVLQHLLGVQRRNVAPTASVTDFLKHELSLILTIMMTLISDVVRLQHGVKASTLCHYDRIDVLKALSQAHDVIKLHEYFQSCQKALAAAQRGVHLNPQLLLENLLIDYHRCCGHAQTS